MEPTYNPADGQQQQPDPYADSFANADSQSVKSMTDSLYREAPATALVTRDPAQRRSMGAVRSMYEFANKHMGGMLDPVLRGATKGYNELGKSVAGGMAWAASKAGASESSDAMQQLRKIQRDGMVTAKIAESALGPDENTGLHAFVRDAAQFATVNELTGGGALAGEATGAAKYAVHALHGAFDSAVGFDPHQQRIANLLEGAPLGIGAVAAKIAANPNDSEATARFKAGLEGLALGSTIDAAVAGLKGAGKGLSDAARTYFGGAAEASAEHSAPKLADFVPADAAEKKPAEPFTVQQTADGQHAVVQTEQADATAQPSEHAAVFEKPEQAEATAASLNYAYRNGQRPRAEVTPDQANYLRSLAKWIKDSGNIEAFQNAKLELPDGTADGGHRDVNFAYDLNPDEVGGMVSAMSKVFRSEIDGARFPDALKRDGESGTQSVTHAETVAKAAQDYNGKTPDEARSRFHQVADALDEVPSSIVAAKVLRQNIAQSAEQLARAMDAAPENTVAHAEFVKATNSLLNTFLAEKRLLSGSGRALNAGQIKIGANGAAVDAEALGRALKDRTVDPLDVIHFQLVDEPLDEAGVSQLDGEAKPSGETTPTEGAGSPAPETPAETAPAAKGKKTVNVTPRQARALARQLMYAPRNEQEREQVLKALLGMTRKATDGEADALPSTWDKVVNYRRWSMLSAPTTPEVNFFSAVSTALYRPIEGMLGGAARLDGETTKRYADMMVGTLKSFHDAMSQAKVSWETGGTVLTSRDASVPLVGEMDNTSAVSKVLGWLGVNERLMTAGDEFAQQIAYRGHVYAQSLAHSRAAGITDAAEIASRLSDDIGSAFDSAGQGQNPSAVAYAQDVTLRRELEYGVGKWVEQGARDIPLVRMLFPFTRIPANLVRFQMDRAPLGLNLLTKRNLTDFAAGGSQRDEVIGRTVAGNMIWGMSAMMAHSGMMTGGGPKDPELRRQWLNVYQPYSIKLPGTDKWVSYRRFEPLSTPLGIVADFMGMVGELENEGDTAKAIDGFAAGVASNLSSKTYLKSLSDFFYAMGSGKATAVDQLVDGMAGSFIPNIVQKANPDDELRTTRDFIDRLQSRIPGFSEALEPRRNIYGEKVLKPGNQFQRMFNPFTVRDDAADPVDVELLRLGAGMSMPVPRKYGVDLQDRSLGVNGQSPYDRWLELMSKPLVNDKSLRDTLREFVQSDQYKSLSDGTEGYKGSRQLGVERMVRGYRQAAFAAMVRENPKIIDAIRAEAMKRGAALSDDPDVTEALTGHSSDAQLSGHAREAAALLGQ